MGFVRVFGVRGGLLEDPSGPSGGIRQDPSGGSWGILPDSGKRFRILGKWGFRGGFAESRAHGGDVDGGLQDSVGPRGDLEEGFEKSVGSASFLFVSVSFCLSFSFF